MSLHASVEPEGRLRKQISSRNQTPLRVLRRFSTCSEPAASSLRFFLFDLSRGHFDFLVPAIATTASASACFFPPSNPALTGDKIGHKLQPAARRPRWQASTCELLNPIQP